MDEERLNELDKKLEQARNEANSISTFVKNEIKSQYEKDKQNLINSEDFKKLTKEITERTAKAELSKDMLAVLNEEQKNELALHILQCEKQKIEYRKKKEKQVVKEEVKAEVFNKKVVALKSKYGYLYDKDDNGEIKNFVPIKIYNKYRSFVNWWDNTTDGFKKITKGILKGLFWTGIVALVIILGYKFFDWVNSLNIPKV